MRVPTVHRMGRIVATTILLVGCGGRGPARPPESPAPVSPAVVRARILGETGEPIPGAQVTVSFSKVGGKSEEEASVVASSDAGGGVALLGVPPGEVEIRAIAPGYATGVFSGPVRSKDALLELRLRRGFNLRANVEDQQHQPVPGATVGLFPEPRTVFLGYPTCLRMDRSARTGSDGACLLTGLRERHYRIVAWTGSGLRGAASTTGGSSEVTVVLEREEGHRRFLYVGLPGEEDPSRVPPDSRVPEDPPPPDEGPPGDEPAEAPPMPAEEAEAPRQPAVARLDVRVLSSDGVPIPRVFVTLKWAEDPDRPRSLGQGSAGPDDTGFERTEEDGRAMLLLQPGRYDLETGPPDFGSDATEVHAIVDVAEGEVRALDIRLPNVFAIPVETRAADGRPLGGVRLEIRRGEEDDRGWTGPDGKKVVFAEKGPDLRILACPEGLPAVSSGSVEIPRSGPVVLQVPPAESIRGRVLDPEGVPLFGVQVAIRREGLEPPDEDSWTAWTDDRGEFSLTGPSAGTYTVAGRSFEYRETLVRGVRVPGGGPVEVRLSRLPRIRGRVLDASGNTLAGVFVDCDGGNGDCCCTAADGSFELAYRFEAEETTLSFSQEGFEAREIRVVPGDGGPLEIRLTREQ